jgi:hypothetical protein
MQADARSVKTMCAGEQRRALEQLAVRAQESATASRDAP